MASLPKPHTPPACPQAASQGNDRALFKQFSDLSTKLSRQIHLRGLLRFKGTAQVGGWEGVCVDGCPCVCVHLCLYMGSGCVGSASEVQARESAVCGLVQRCAHKSNFVISSLHQFHHNLMCTPLHKATHS